jgi:hypothetical protein
MSVSPAKLRLQAPKEVSVGDIQKHLETYMADHNSRDLSSLLAALRKTTTWKSSPVASTLAAYSKLFCSLVDLSPQAMLPPKKTAMAILACHTEKAVNFTGKQDPIFADEVSSLLRCGLSKYRELAREPEKQRRCFGKASVEEKQAIMDVISGMSFDRAAACSIFPEDVAAVSPGPSMPTDFKDTDALGEFFMAIDKQADDMESVASTSYYSPRAVAHHEANDPRHPSQLVNIASMSGKHHTMMFNKSTIQLRFVFNFHTYTINRTNCVQHNINAEVNLNPVSHSMTDCLKLCTVFGWSSTNTQTHATHADIQTYTNVFADADKTSEPDCPTSSVDFRKVGYDAHAAEADLERELLHLANGDDMEFGAQKGKAKAKAKAKAKGQAKAKPKGQAKAKAQEACTPTKNCRSPHSEAGTLAKKARKPSNGLVADDEPETPDKDAKYEAKKVYSRVYHAMYSEAQKSGKSDEEAKTLARESARVAKLAHCAANVD